MDAYFRCIEARQNRTTFITQYVGMFTLRLQTEYGLQYAHFMCMSNTFYTPLELAKRYDLKGFTVRRAASARERKAKDAVLMDFDLWHSAQRIAIGGKRRQNIMKQIERDCAFLERIGVTDYSVLLGVHKHTARDRANCNYCKSIVDRDVGCESPHCVYRVRAASMALKLNPHMWPVQTSASIRTPSSHLQSSALATPSFRMARSSRHVSSSSSLSSSRRVPGAAAAAAVAAVNGAIATSATAAASRRSVSATKRLSRSPSMHHQQQQPGARSASSSFADLKQAAVAIEPGAASVPPSPPVVGMSALSAALQSQQQHVLSPSDVKSVPASMSMSSTTSSTLSAAGSDFVLVDTTVAVVNPCRCTTQGALFRRDPHSGRECREEGIHSSTLSEVYFIAIIDALQPYSLPKIMESFGKRILKYMLGEKNDVTILAPPKYSYRMQRFVAQIISEESEFSPEAIAPYVTQKQKKKKKKPKKPATKQQTNETAAAVGGGGT
jgi:hypothetical protein